MMEIIAELMREINELRDRVNRLEALEFVKKNDSPTLTGLNLGSATGAAGGSVYGKSSSVSVYFQLDRPNNTATDAYLWHKTGGTTQWLAGIGLSGGASGSESYRIVRDTTGAGAYSTYLSVDVNGNISGTAGTTSMTNGFLYIPSAAGAPSGTPTTITNTTPLYYDRTNKKLYAYNTTSVAWESAQFA